MEDDGSNDEETKRKRRKKQWDEEEKARNAANEEDYKALSIIVWKEVCKFKTLYYVLLCQTTFYYSSFAG